MASPTRRCSQELHRESSWLFHGRALFEFFECGGKTHFLNPTVSSRPRSVVHDCVTGCSEQKLLAISGDGVAGRASSGPAGKRRASGFEQRMRNAGFECRLVRFDVDGHQLQRRPDT